VNGEQGRPCSELTQAAPLAADEVVERHPAGGSHAAVEHDAQGSDLGHPHPVAVDQVRVGELCTEPLLQGGDACAVGVTEARVLRYRLWPDVERVEVAAR